jgi:hypothetical protein
LKIFAKTFPLRKSYYGLSYHSKIATATMKKNLYTLSAIMLGLGLWISNAAGPGTVQGIDRTGSPLSPGTCVDCHSGGTFSPSVTAQLLDNGTPVTEYQPDRDYTLRVTTTAGAGTPARYGFQAVALTGTGNTNAGTFGANPAGFKKITIQNRVYIEHSSPRTNNTMEFPWKSPATLDGTIRFYAAGLAANNSGSSLGDSGASLSEALAITPLVSSAGEAAAVKPAIRVLGNPIGENLRLLFNSPESGHFLFELAAMDGRIIWRQTQAVQSGENQLNFDATALPRGTYLLRAQNGTGSIAVKVLK